MKAPFNLISLLKTAGTPRIGVIGDVMLDRYLHGTVDRVSPEAPVPIIRVDKKRTSITVGGAGCVALDLAALGAHVWIAGLVGHDEAGQMIEEHLEAAGVMVALDRESVSDITDSHARETTQKTRFIGHGQQMLRMDEQASTPIGPATTKALQASIAEQMPGTDILILSDYLRRGGVLSLLVIGSTLRYAEQLGIPVWVDPARHRHCGDFHGVAGMTPNRKEAEEASEMLIDGSLPALETCGEEFIDDLEIEVVVITLDAQGLFYRTKEAESAILPAQVREVRDVTGAGDMVVAALTFALACKAPLRTALEFANFAAGMEVERFGAQPITRDEMLLRLNSSRGDEKVIEVPMLKAMLENRTRHGETLVFTNGCFDLLHRGHLDCLSFAARQGDILVVGLNSDKGVKALKGNGRPIMPQGDRAALLSQLETVDYVVLFDEDTPEELIRELRPDVLVKGGEWGDGIAGQEFVEAQGGKVIFVERLRETSTSGILKRIRGV